VNDEYIILTQNADGIVVQQVVDEVIVLNDNSDQVVVNEVPPDTIIIHEGPVSYFTKSLSGLAVTIGYNEHGLTQVRGVKVLNPTGYEVGVKSSINLVTQQVSIESNISLENHTAIIY
jgi:hypothetical protein